MKCKYCDSTNVVKYGTFEGVQRYWCKDCKRKFADNDALPKMKTPKKVIASALSCYFGGMPLDQIQRHLQQQYNLYFSEMGIYNWVKRFSQEAVDSVKDFKPKVGNTWVADETVLKVGGRNIWFWDIIDADSRYLLASHISLSRTTNDARRLIEQAVIRAGKIPKFILTDKLAAYQDGINLAIDNLEIDLDTRTRHIPVKGITAPLNTNLIERFHGTLKDRVNVFRGFNNMESAKLLTDAWLVHYNFFKEHTALGDVPPAQKMGDVPVRDWADVVEGAEVMLTPKESRSRLVGVKPSPEPKPRHKRRGKSKVLRGKVHTEVTLATMRGK